jgi:O-antigen/teichoic acid export membrane protein
MEGLKQKVVRGGFAKLCGQAANIVLRLLSVVVLARLLNPEDFGLVAMVTVVTGVYELFTSAGLSSATVQKESVTDAQVSTLFWINILVGCVLAALCLATAPALVAFYNEPRLFWITAAVAAGFVFNAAGVQHYALLQRQLRYISLTLIETLALVASVAVAVGLAIAGAGYWALVAMAVASPVVSTACMWAAAGWMPKPPRRGTGIGSMLRFGGTITLNGVVVYAAYNVEKILLGRYWGAESLGIYGRAYQLISFPTANLSSAIGTVAIAALSRLQNDPILFKSYFLKGYALANSITIPATIFCAMFADDIIMIMLGPKWADAVAIFRLLTPAILIFGVINPLSWLLVSTGRQERSLAIALVIAPLVIAAYIVGLPYGPQGVALAYSSVLALWLVPHVVWSLHGTLISSSELCLALSRPVLSGIAAAAFTFGTLFLMEPLRLSLLRLGVGGAVMLAAYVWVLFYPMGQKAFYLDLLRGLKRPSPRLANETDRFSYSR